MKKFTSYKVLCVTLGLGIALSGTVLNAASLTKTLKAVYSNIAISYNGQTKALTSEPFMVNGTTYVPLRAIGEIMGSNVSWANNTVYITSSTLPSTSAEQEIAAKNFEIASLKQQLDLAKKELETYKGTGVPGSNLTTSVINNTLSKITSTYANDYNIGWTIDLRQVSGRLELTVSYDTRNDSSRFNSLSESRRKQFIKDICYDIAAIHRDIDIRGTLRESRNNLEVASFKYTSSGSYTYDEKSSLSLSDFSKDLARYYREIDITNPRIPVEYIEVTERSRTLTISLYVNLTAGSTYRSAWNSVNRLSLVDYFDNIVYEAKKAYNTYDDIVILIKDTSPGSPGIVGKYENGYPTIYVRND